jgi:pimeloyl-ACP methyl ester carboxylesterase
MVDALRARELDVIVYDARGHGASEGSSTLGDLEEHDVAAAVRCAEERTDRIVVVGASMGAIAALRFASRPRPSIAGVVALSCPARWSLPFTVRGIAAALLTRTPPGRALASRVMRVRISGAWNQPAPPHELIAQVSAPVAVIHGTHDSFIPPTSAHELYEHAPDPRSLLIVDEMGHAFSDAAVEPVCDAVEWALATSGPGRRLAG